MKIFVTIAAALCLAGATFASKGATDITAAALNDPNAECETVKDSMVEHFNAYEYCLESGDTEAVYCVMRRGDRVTKADCERILRRHRSRGYFVKEDDSLTCAEAAGDDFSGVTLVIGDDWKAACNGDPSAKVTLCEVPKRTLKNTRKTVTRSSSDLPSLAEIMASYLETTGKKASALNYRERKPACNTLPSDSAPAPAEAPEEAAEEAGDDAEVVDSGSD